MNSLTQGGFLLRRRGGWNCAAAVATAPGIRHAAINNARRKFMNMILSDPGRIIAGWPRERSGLYQPAECVGKAAIQRKIGALAKGPAGWR